jgi:hypothetical protein
MSGGFDMGGNWSIKFRQYEGTVFRTMGVDSLTGRLLRLRGEVPAFRTMLIDVDATHVTRRVIHSHLQIPVSGPKRHPVILLQGHDFARLRLELAADFAAPTCQRAEKRTSTGRVLPAGSESIRLKVR